MVLPKGEKERVFLGSELQWQFCAYNGSFLDAQWGPSSGLCQMNSTLPHYSFYTDYVLFYPEKDSTANRLFYFLSAKADKARQSKVWSLLTHNKSQYITAEILLFFYLFIYFQMG